MTEKQDIAGKCLIEEDELSLKTYLFRSVEHGEDAVAHLREAVEKYQLARYGSVGVSFLYGFRGRGGFVNGADIVIFREPEGNNTVLNSWTIENGLYVPREAGIMCADELLLLAKEEEQRRRALQYLRNKHITEKEFLRLFLEHFPK